MKKSLNLFAVVLLIVLSAACNKNEKPLDPQEAEQVKVTYIRAEGGESSKASISDSDATFAWNTGDQIAVYADGYKISDGLSSTYNATNNATFSFSGANVVDENDRANFAVFPASLVYDSGSNLYDTDVTESSLKINLPSSYTLAQVQDEVSPVPMIATNVKDGDLAFKSICALVRVTAVNISKDADHIAVTFPGKKVQGEFTLTSVAPGTTGVVTANTDGTDDTITITDLGISSFTASLVLNVPVPSGVADSQEYNDIKVTVYDSGNHKINSITTPLKLSAGVPVAWAPSRKASRKVTATLPVFDLTGSKKVVFAPGNLLANISTLPTEGSPVGEADSWKFADYQYTVIGNVNENKLVKKGYIDLFSWVGASAESDSYGILYKKTYDGSLHGSSDSDALKTDWGHNVINDAVGAYAADVWRTPSGNDWTRVFTTRPASTVTDNTDAPIDNARFVKASINGINGLIIFPDYYQHPYGVDAPAKINDPGVTDALVAFTVNEYSLAAWEKLEAAGCVFLPAAGYREYTSGGAPFVGQVNTYAMYWSKTPVGGNPQRAYGVWYNNEKGWPSSNSRERRNGYAVRLVRDVK